MSNLPIRRVVLYKHGVGYFERETSIEGDQSLSLSFKQREVSDVLKSLTVLDLNGGTVSAVSYDSTTPIEQLLAEIALSIPDSGSLTGLLPQIKGARISVKPTGGATLQGAILGIDKTDTHSEHGLQETHRLSLLTDAGDVRTFDLFDLELTILDEGIKRDLDFYLKTQLASKKKDARTFTLFAHFRPLDALLNQPFGVVLFGSTVVAAIIGLVDLVTGKGLWRTALGWIGDHEVKVASVLFFGMLGGWIYKVLLMHPTLLPG